MDVVLVGVHFLEQDVGMVLGPGAQVFFQVALNPFVEDLAPVFGRPYQMKVTGKDTMAHPAVHGHGL